MLQLMVPRPVRRAATPIVVIIACFSAACRSSGPAAAPPVAPDTWAVVDGREITREQVEKALRRIGDGSPPPANEEGTAAKLSVLEDLIIEDILLARARELKIEVPETEVDKAFNEARQNIPEEAFQQELTRRNLTPADMRDGLRRELVVQKVMEQEVVSKINVTDQDVTDFFNANRAQFNLPEDAYHLAQIVVTPVREPQVPNRTGNDASTPQEAQEKVAMLMERLKAGTPFRELAMDFSEDPESTPRGGDMGLVPMSTLNQVPPALRNAALETTPGTARVVSQGGAHTIVYVVAREPAGQRELTTPGVRENITQTLRGQREQLLRTAYLTNARGEADVVNHLARRVLETQGKL